MKKLSNVFLLLAVLLSDVMCAVVAYNYCYMEWGIEFASFSTPANVAFVYAIPYLVGIAICIVVAVVLKRKGR